MSWNQTIIRESSVSWAKTLAGGSVMPSNPRLGEMVVARSKQIMLQGGFFLADFTVTSSVLDDELAGEAARDGAEAVRHRLGGGVQDPHEEVAERRFVDGESGGDEVRRRGETEVELREEGPKAAPAAGECAGLAGGGGVEALKDKDEGVVWERAETVQAGASVVVLGRLGARDGGLASALVHGEARNRVFFLK